MLNRSASLGMSSRVLKALPGKLDIKRHSSYILYLSAVLSLCNLCEPWYESSNNVVCATSKASDQPAHTRSLVRVFASRLNILGVLSYWPSFEVCKLERRLHRLIWVYTCQNATLLEITCHGSCCFYIGALEKYHEVNGLLPERIIVFRDGVGDGQLAAVFEHEVQQMCEAFQKAGGQGYQYVQNCC